MNMRIINVVGTRPNFMKAAPILKEMKRYSSFHPFLIIQDNITIIICRMFFLRI